MRFLPYLSLATIITCRHPVTAQTPEAKETEGTAQEQSTPAAAPSRESVEKYVSELTELIGTRETSVTRLVNEITAQDRSIQASVEKVLRILTTSKDSAQTRSKVAQMKAETLEALKRASQAYAQKRALIIEELGTTKNEYRREDLFSSRGQIDTRIDTMVDAMLKLALSMETDEGHERYIQDASLMVGRRGVSVPTVKRNPDFNQNKHQAAKTEQITGELDKALAASLQRLDTQERDVVTKLAAPGVSEEEKVRLTAEMQRIQIIRGERAQQQIMLGSGGPAGGQNELDRKEAMQTGELVDSITAGARRDFANMMAAFTALRTERQALATLKAKLDNAANWLETHPAVK